MDWEKVLVSFLPLIIFVILLIFLFTRTGRRKVTVYMISAVKPEFPDKIEMRVSTDKSEIDDWEKTFWGRGYRVSQRTDEITIKRMQPMLMNR